MLCFVSQMLYVVKELCKMVAVRFVEKVFDGPVLISEPSSGRQVSFEVQGNKADVSSSFLDLVHSALPLVKDERASDTSTVSRNRV